MKTKIVLFIPHLSVGGAERQLIELARGLDKSKWDVVIMTMYEKGHLLQEANSIPGVKVMPLRKGSPLFFLWKLLKNVLKEKANILYCFLSTAQLYASLNKVFLPKTKLVYRIGDSRGRHENLGYKNYFVNFILRMLKNSCDFYVFNSQAGRNIKSLDLPAGKIGVIHNGTDTDKFQPSLPLRQKFRKDLGVSEETVLIGRLGNFSAYKDHQTLIKAAHLMVQNGIKNIHFVAIGEHHTPSGEKAVDLVKTMQMESHFTFLGVRLDVGKILPGLDIGCSSSSTTEGFPNNICELMACGIPCVVTNVGDCALIVGDTGAVVPKSDPEALAKGLISLLKLSSAQRAGLGQKARLKISAQYSLFSMVQSTEELFENLLIDEKLK